MLASANQRLAIAAGEAKAKNYRVVQPSQVQEIIIKKKTEWEGRETRIGGSMSPFIDLSQVQDTKFITRKIKKSSTFIDLRTWW